MTDEGRRALVLGVTGSLGDPVARGLLARGWCVTALTRAPERARRGRPAAITWRRGDAMVLDDVRQAAHGAALIVHAVNPPLYRDWRGLALPMLRHSLAAARASGARLVFPGNIYNFAPEAGPWLSEDTPQRPHTRKGAVRVEMEAMLCRAAEDGVRSLVVRAGDFFGPSSRGAGFGPVMVTPPPPASPRWVTGLGLAGTGHAWAYLPDLARAILALAEREAELPGHAVFHFAGHWLESDAVMVDAIRRAAGGSRLPGFRFPWGLARLASPMVPLFREMLEMRYIWRTPLRLDNRKLVAFLGEEPHTPLDEAVRRTLAAARAGDGGQ